MDSQTVSVNLTRNQIQRLIAALHELIDSEQKSGIWTSDDDKTLLLTLIESL
jgi:hypothetical protein